MPPRFRAKLGEHRHQVHQVGDWRDHHRQDVLDETDLLTLPFHLLPAALPVSRPVFARITRAEVLALRDLAEHFENDH